MSRFNLKQKIIIFLVAFVGMFSAGCVNAVSVSAASDKPDFTGVPAYDHTKYPYYFTYYYKSYDDRLDIYYYKVAYVISDKPTCYVSISNRGDIYTIYSLYVLSNSLDTDYLVSYGVGESKHDDKPYFSFNAFAKPTNYVFDVNEQTVFTNGYVSSNYDIKDEKGNLVFRKPLLTEEMMAPVVTEVQEGSPIIVGGMICLIVLGVSLAGLVMYLKPFLRQ